MHVNAKDQVLWTSSSSLVFGPIRSHECYHSLGHLVIIETREYAPRCLKHWGIHLGKKKHCAFKIFSQSETDDEPWWASCSKLGAPDFQQTYMHDLSACKCYHVHHVLPHNTNPLTNVDTCKYIYIYTSAPVPEVGYPNFIHLLWVRLT